MNGRDSPTLKWFADARRTESVCQYSVRPELTRTGLGLAEPLLMHYPNEHDTSIEHLDLVVAEYPGHEAAAGAGRTGLTVAAVVLCSLISRR